MSRRRMGLTSSIGSPYRDVMITRTTSLINQQSSLRGHSKPSFQPASRDPMNLLVLAQQMFHPATSNILLVLHYLVVCVDVLLCYCSCLPLCTFACTSSFPGVTKEPDCRSMSCSAHLFQEVYLYVSLILISLSAIIFLSYSYSLSHAEDH